MPAEKFHVRTCQVVAVLLLFCASADVAQARHVAVPGTGLRAIHFNQAPPDFNIPEGKSSVPLSSLVGKPVVINFWASWCHVCADEAPAFAKMESEFGGRVAFVTLSDEAPGVAHRYLAQHDLDFPLVEDPDGAIFARYSVSPIPVTIVVEPDGKVGYVAVGELTWPELEGVLNKALAEPGTTGAGSVVGTHLR
ncbi:MAG: TlpA family protein disulfide reductase [Candidatus Eremiobacteraeota bacterium]|nr:TlpA family protein disulfide reductase [Candidatus Eremiobacteraeota bacterium]